MSVLFSMPMLAASSTSSGFLVGVETVAPFTIELPRRLLRGRAARSRSSSAASTRASASLARCLRFVLELLRLAVGFLGGRARSFGGLVG
jgi:hypothetical protein